MKEVIEAADQLPAFPEVIWKVMPLVQRMAPVAEIEAVIRYDQVIAARVLAMSQSAYYARRQPVASLRDAIVALGQQQLLQAIMAACAARYYNGKSDGYDLREGELWEHAVATALMTEKVGRAIGYEGVLTAYTAALLHDIGKTVLHFYVESTYETILDLVRGNRLPFLDAEREVLGIDHQQLGAEIARRWRFPEEVVTAIAYHHYPLQAPNHSDLVALVYVANRMVSALGIGCGVDGFLQPNQDQVFVRLQISSKMVEKLLADLVDALRVTRQFLAPQ
jgi:putative nucleotidyltransferase with HDIG domain